MDSDHVIEVEETGPKAPIKLSINSLVGLAFSQMMKLKGCVTGQEVVVMIDSGATHNFNSDVLITKLGLPVDSTGSLVWGCLFRALGLVAMSCSLYQWWRSLMISFFCPKETSM